MKLATVGEVQARSSIYLTEPVGGPPNQPLYLNAVLVLAPGAGLDRPEALLEVLLEIERGQGRVRRERWGARSLDLDLLSVGGRIVDRPQLTLPHPRMMGRAFVLAPLCEVAPGWRHPVTAEGACEALERVGSEFVVPDRPRLAAGVDCLPMRLFAIADPHLSSALPMPMNIFGPNWEGHPEAFFEGWRSVVGRDDLVLIPGDLSWARTLEGAMPDLESIAALPGRKVILRGNHDFWWPLDK